jgi:hypothetical protein
MKEKIEARLAELRTEFETGQRMLAELEEKREKLRESMLRIAGAIQVLEEVGGEVGGEGEKEDPKEESDVHASEQL